MAICKYDNQTRSDLCGSNAEYITRLSKVAEIHFHNLPELENGIALEDLQSRRNAAMAYAETRELESNKNKRIKNSKPKINPKTGKPVPTRQDRNHHTLIFSWDRTETPEKAIQMTREFLEEKLPNARAIYSVHVDKDGQTHTHVFLDTKIAGTGKKLQIAPKTFYNFDSAWAQKYDSEYGTTYAPIFRERSDATREWKREAAQAKARGEEFTTPKPERYGDLIKANLRENMRARELQNIGATHDQTRNRTGERTITAGRAGIESSKRAIDSGKQRIAAANRNFDATIREAKEYLERQRIREQDERAH